MLKGAISLVCVVGLWGCVTSDEITRLDQVIQLFDTTDEAISSFGGGG